MEDKQQDKVLDVSLNSSSSDHVVPEHKTVVSKKRRYDEVEETDEKKETKEEEKKEEREEEDSEREQQRDKKKVKKYVSPTLNDGVQFTATYDPESKKFTDLTWDGDMLWGRKGRYFTSFFMLIQIYIRAVKEETYVSALQKLKKAFEMVCSFAKGSKGDHTEQQPAIKEYLITLQAQAADHEPDEHKIKHNIQELSKMILDMHVHLPTSFVICRPASAAELQKQKDCLAVLDQYEKRLGGK